MDQALIVTAAVFASGFIVGYVISRGNSRAIAERRQNGTVDFFTKALW